MIDMDACSVGVVVVYKIDRLTRSPAVFAKLVEIDVVRGSDPAVNTTTSMGRLILNVLLCEAGSLKRISATELEAAVLQALRIKCINQILR